MLGVSMNPLDWVTSAAGTVLGAAGEAIFDQMVNWVVEGLADLTRQFAESVAGLASVDVGSSSMTQLSGVFKWVALATVLGLKVRREERMLLARYPDYAAYRARTHRIVPGLF